VGCPDSPKELDELHTLIDAGHSDKEILTLFSAKYGATVLAAPTTEGFNLVAWIAPFAVFGAALLGTILLVRRWANVSIGKTQAVLAGVDSGDDADRERREKIRRETGDGGF
jgi:cytochrome c-type biogenesis protein CcmH